MSRSCVCGGSNENCRYCNGRGEISNSLADALIAHLYLPESKKVHVGDKQRPKNSTSIKPTLRKWKAPLEKLRQLRASVSGQRPPDPSAASAAAPHASQLASYPSGNVQPSQHNVDGYSQQVPASASGKSPQPSFVSPTTSRVYKVCPVCGVKVRSDRVNPHLQKVHRVRRAEGNDTLVFRDKSGKPVW